MLLFLLFENYHSVTSAPVLSGSLDRHQCAVNYRANLMTDLSLFLSLTVYSWILPLGTNLRFVIFRWHFPSFGDVTEPSPITHNVLSLVLLIRPDGRSAGSSYAHGPHLRAGRGQNNHWAQSKHQRGHDDFRVKILQLQGHQQRWVNFWVSSNENDLLLRRTSLF